jgi:transitional endoplasmic reticulum ATPase
LTYNEDVEFPDRLCKAIAEITDGFSFAYMQEAFVAALLAIARMSDGDGRSDPAVLIEDVEGDWVGVLSAAPRGREDLDKFILWVEIKKQIKILREGMETERD